MLPESPYTLTVYLEDVDAGGVVYHANYLKYAERARTEWLKSRGLSHAAFMRESGGGVIVAELAIIYRQPARLEDALAVRTELANISPARAQLEQTIFRDSDVIAELKVTLACVNNKGRPVRWPDDLQQAFNGKGYE